MKLRIKGNSIRLRLGQSEVRRLLTEGVVSESTTFNLFLGQRLEYGLCTATNLPAMTASFEDSRIMVRMPASVMRNWASTDQVGVETTQVGSDGSMLNILVEKDFECIDSPHEESQEDAFPNPQIGTAC
jgi:hypothetical protein